MGLFSFTQELAIDLGTANTIIISNGKVLVDESSIVALDKRTDKLIAVGEVARQMHEKTHPNIVTVRPLRDGVIANFYAAEQMIRGMIKKVDTKNRWFAPSLRMVVCIPSGSTEVEIRAVRDSAEHAGGRDVYMIYEPMAAAIGIGLDVEAPQGNMIVDIGGGTTEIAVISLGGIVSNKSIRIAGDDLTADIQEYMGRQHNVRVGERTAEEIKIHVGSVLTELDNPPEDYIVHGPNRMTSLPMEVPVNYQEIAHCLEKSITKIEAAVL
ncbi:MAG: rod shape-determining protein, partial [Bacteroidales bacterium]